MTEFTTGSECMELEFKARKLRLSKPMLVWQAKKPPGLFRRLRLFRNGKFKILNPLERDLTEDEISALAVEALIPWWVPEDARGMLRDRWGAKVKAIVKAIIDANERVEA